MHMFPMVRDVSLCNAAPAVLPATACAAPTVRGIQPERPDVRSHLQFASASLTRVLCALCAVRRPLRPHGDRTHALRGTRVRAWCTQTTYLEAIHVLDLSGRKRDKRLKRAHVTYAPDAGCFFS
jgi:hypothetical protein